MNKVIISLFLLVAILGQLNAILEPVKKIELPESPFLQAIIGFCVTDNQEFVLVDYSAGDLKIYDKNCKHLQTLGRKGYGPNEFAQPHHASFDSKVLTISDFGQRKIFYYKRNKKGYYKRIKQIALAAVGNDKYTDGNTIYISGNAKSTDGINYEFYFLDVDKADRKFLLPGYLKYGLKSQAQYNTEMMSKRELTCIGGRGIFDIYGDYAYYIWEGDLKIFKIHLKTKKITTFGNKSPQYVKPYTTPKLIDAFFSRKEITPREDKKEI